MAASSSSSESRELMRLRELPWGVVRTFKPTYAELAGHYLCGKIMMMVRGGNGKQAFPELEVYGKTGIEPWTIWESLQPIKIPHQEFLYFFTRVKSLSKKGKGKRCSRIIGSGGTWSETEASKKVYVDGFQEPFGRMKKFRYENSDTESDHHGAWIMEEISIDHPVVVPSNLVLCRLKRNEKVNNKRKRKSIKNEDVNAKRTKIFLEEKQVISHEQQHFHLQQELLCGDNVAHQAGLEQAPHFDNYNFTVGDVIVSQNEHAELEEDTGGWLDEALEEDDLVITNSQSEEEGTDYNVSASECAGMETLPLSPALLEQVTSSSPLMSQQQDLSSTVDDQGFDFACDNYIIPVDGVSFFQFDDSTNFYFHFENQNLSEEATLP